MRDLSTDYLRHFLQGDDLEEDTEEEILRTVAYANDKCDNYENVRESQILENVKIWPSPTSCHLVSSGCDYDGLSSDSGFSDHSADLGTRIQPISQTRAQELWENTDMKIYLQKDKVEKRLNRKRRILETNSYSIFIIIPLFIISHIKCFNNTCAVYISPHITYYHTQRVIYELCEIH